MKSGQRQRQHSEEIELKLALPSSAPSSLAKRLAKMPSVARRMPAHLPLYNVCYDTPDQLLRQKRVAFRIRRMGIESRPQWLQTLKMGGQDYSALSQRGEWEANLYESANSAIAPALAIHAKNDINCYHHFIQGEKNDNHALRNARSQICRRQDDEIRQKGGSG